MKAKTLLYLTPRACLGSHAGGWRVDLDEAGLPAPNQLLAQLPEVAFSAAQLAVLIADSQMHPLRVTVETKVKKSELSQYLGWKLKRFLPWPIDQVSLRYLPLAEPDTWLTFALPTTWLDALYAGFRERGVACGYIGGAFATLLEQQPRLRNHTNICFFDDTYMVAELDGSGAYRTFKSRRLPFRDLEGGQLDIDTLHHQDLAAAIGAEHAPPQLICLAAEHDGAIAALARRFEADGLAAAQPKLAGSPTQRLEACLFTREVWP